MIAKTLVLRVDGKSMDTIPYTDEISERKKIELKDWKYKGSNDIEDAWQNSVPFFVGPCWIGDDSCV